jgi:hypothetical protein
MVSAVTPDGAVREIDLGKVIETANLIRGECCTVPRMQRSPPPLRRGALLS